MSTRKLLLVQPRFGNEKLDRNKGTLPPLGLAYVAAYTPEPWQVEILDEHVERRPLEQADLVGISTTTLTINRAYEIADQYRAQGTPVVFGGIHASVLPDEALQHADAVVIGDAEPVWQSLLDDFDAGSLQQVYRSHPFDLRGLRAPRTELFSSKYMLFPVSASRGCPFNCEFCAINRFYEGKYRTRPADEVIEDILRVPQGNIFFTDGNIYGYNKPARENFMEICRLIIRERERDRLRFKHWMAYSSVNGLDDREALRLAARSGCRALAVGFESINEESLKEMGKAVNLKYGVERYKELVRNAHREGILVIAEIILGFDNDTEETVALTQDFVRESEIDILRLQLLQPLPGTRLYDKLAAEGRLLISDFPREWEKFRDSFVMGVHYELTHFEARRLQSLVKQIGTDFYSLPRVCRRMARILWLTRDPSLVALALVNSVNSRKTYVNFEL